MKPIRLATLCVALGLAAVFNSNSYAQTASDNAGNYSGVWTNGVNGGTGFGPWAISSGNGTGAAGNFIGDPTAAGITGFGTQAFGLYANPSGSGAYVSIDRSLTNSLSAGQTFELKWAVNYDADGGNKGFNLFSGGPGNNEILNVNQGGFPGDITINGTNTGMRVS